MYKTDNSDIYADASYKVPAWVLENTVADWYDRNAEGENDHYSPPAGLFNLAFIMTEVYFPY